MPDGPRTPGTPRGPAMPSGPGRPGGPGKPGAPGSRRRGPGRSGAGPAGTQPRRRPRRGGSARRGGIQRASPARRLRFGLLCAGIALSLIAGRLIQLQGLDGTKYQALAERQRLHTISVPSERGRITTADGTILAMTVQTDTVTADPAQITGTTPERTSALRQRIADALAGPLRMPPATITGLLDHPSSPDYVVLARSISFPAATHVSALLSKLNAVGVYLTPAFTRSYPGGDLASNLVGFTTTTSAGDLRGQAGIEESYNQLLAGRDGEQEVEAGANGQPIPVASDWIRPMVPGGDVRLTILSGLQWEAQQACAHEVSVARADNCTVVVMQPRTGKILALAQYPTYQPTNITSLAATQDLPVSAVFPPGSTAKVITAAAALEHGQTPMSPYTVPEQIVVNGYPFHDAEWHPTEQLTLAGVLAHSSNVGMVQVAGHVSPQTQYQYFRAFGIGAPTGLPLPGSSPGLLAPPSQWWGDQRYTLAFGQGVSVTAMQMAEVYATIANGGVRVPPTIVAGTTGADGQYVPAPRPRGHRVLKPATDRELIAILQQVPMLDATLADQPWGEIPGYSIAAKTGTAQVGKCLCQYGSSYIGMVPASNPQVVVAVNVQNPRSADYFGNAVAGPVFYHVMKFALQTLKIPPDHGQRPNVRLTAP